MSTWWRVKSREQRDVHLNERTTAPHFTPVTYRHLLTPTSLFVGIASTVCGARSVQRSGVCLSVRLSHPTAAAACGRFAAERRAGRRYRSTAAVAGRRSTVPQHGAQQQMQTLTAELARLRADLFFAFSMLFICLHIL